MYYKIILKDKNLKIPFTTYITEFLEPDMAFRLTIKAFKMRIKNLLGFSLVSYVRLCYTFLYDCILFESFPWKSYWFSNRYST